MRLATFQFWDTTRPRWLQMLVDVAVLAGAFALIVRAIEGFARLPTNMWNSIRVAPPVAFAKGFDLYYGADAGPVLNTPYGPVWGLLYTPAALADSPTPALGIALCISLLVFFGPLVWLALRWVGRGNALLALAAFVVLMPAQLERSVFTHHADPPALGFGACAIACLTYRHGARRSLALTGAAVFVALAVWAKQTVVLLAPALWLYVAVADGRAMAIRFAGALVASGLAISGAFALTFGEPMLFNMFSLQGSHPWKEPFGQTLADTLVIGGGLLLLPAGCIALAVGLGKRAAGLRAFVREHAWVALLFAGLGLAPLAIAGVLHRGGSVNAFSVTTYYVVAAAALCLAGAADGRDPGRRRARTGVAVLVVPTLALWQLAQPGVYEKTETYLSQLTAWHKNPLERAASYARAHPGTVYFPDNPLIALLAEGALHHSEPGIYEREVGGVVVTDARRRAHLPPAMRYVARLGRWHELPPIREILPEFERRVRPLGLGGWRVWAEASLGRDPLPDVFLLLVDTLRADRLGLYGYPRGTSPHLDRFAESAVVFDHVFSPASWTLPAIGSLFTGTYPSVHGLKARVGASATTALRPGLVTLTESLRDAGYRTAAVVSNPWVENDKHGLLHAFDEVRAVGDAGARAVHEAGRDLVEADDGRPLFLYLHYMDPHGPYQRHAASRAGLLGPLPEGLDRPLQPRELSMMHSYLRIPGLDTLGAYIDLYDRSIYAWDEAFGEWMAWLDARGGAQSIVLVTSDHGEEFADHGGWNHGETLYQEQLAVPWVLRATGLEPERVEDRVVSLIDVAPTLLSMLELPVPETMTGHDVRFAGDESRALFSETDLGPKHGGSAKRATRKRSLRRGSHKLIATPEGFRFYDLASDPGEVRPLADPAWGARALADLERWQRSSEQASRALGAAVGVELDDEDRARLQALGYE